MLRCERGSIALAALDSAASAANRSSGLSDKTCPHCHLQGKSRFIFRVPAGTMATNAAVNWRDYSRPRWQLWN